MTEPVDVQLQIDASAVGGATTRLALDGSGVLLRAAATLAAKTLTSLTVERLRFGAQDLAATVQPTGGNGYRIAVMRTWFVDPFAGGRQAGGASSHRRR